VLLPGYLKNKQIQTGWERPSFVNRLHWTTWVCLMHWKCW